MIRALALATTLLATSAYAVEIQKSGPQVWPSKHELTAQLGYQAGFGGAFQTPSGLRLTGEYAYRFHPIAWFDLQLSNLFGFGSEAGFCVNSVNTFCYRGGWAFGIAGGVKLKFTTPIPLVIETPILIGVDILYNRECGDNGAAGPLLRTGATAKYFITNRIGLGAAANFAFAPAFHNASHASCSRGAYTDFYGSFEFALNAEFLL